MIDQINELPEDGLIFCTSYTLLIVLYCFIFVIDFWTICIENIPFIGIFSLTPSGSRVFAVPQLGAQGAE